jgi:hypothetical protein
LNSAPPAFKILIKLPGTWLTRSHLPIPGWSVIPGHLPVDTRLLTTTEPRCMLVQILLPPKH